MKEKTMKQKKEICSARTFLSMNRVTHSVPAVSLTNTHTHSHTLAWGAWAATTTTGMPTCSRVWYVYSFHFRFVARTHSRRTVLFLSNASCVHSVYILWQEFRDLKTIKCRDVRVRCVYVFAVLYLYFGCRKMCKFDGDDDNGLLISKCVENIHTRARCTNTSRIFGILVCARLLLYRVSVCARANQSCPMQYFEL